MKKRFFVIVPLAAFVILCGYLVVRSGVFGGGICPDCGGVTLLASQATITADTAETTATTGETEGAAPKAADKNVSDKYDFSRFRATHDKLETRVLGALYPEIERTDDPEKFKFQMVVTTNGAGIDNVVLSEFDDRDPKNPQPFQLLGPWLYEAGRDVVTEYTLANGHFALTGRNSFPLGRLNWAIARDVETAADGSQSIVFEAILKDNNGFDAIRLTKTFRIQPGTYQLDCRLQLENLSDAELDTMFSLQGPGGMTQEGERGDMRKVMAAYVSPAKKIDVVKRDNSKLRKAARSGDIDALELKHKAAQMRFVWAATANKYFAAVLRPIPQPEQDDRQDELRVGLAQYYDSDLNARFPSQQAASGFTLKANDVTLAPKGAPGSQRTFDLSLYLGPKDRDLFNKNPVYKELAYFNTIDFHGCCCPTSVIAPLAFGIMTLMKWMYHAMGPLGNYGVVIMILVFFVRLVMHPVTKKSQVSMMKMQKLGPMMEEIKQKYAGNKAEMNKKVMELYRQQGVSPVASFLPMLLQMPVWIALWTAIYTSIELRGAGFLPFWITDLSSPDALIRFKEFTVPLLGWQIDSFNLLPILMGVVMYLQQKLMPHSKAAEQTNPQIAQQQKMMMILMPLMFPFMLYKGPSGVNLYIMSSISAGIVEQIVIRKHLRDKEEEESKGLVAVTKKTGGKVKKKKPKPFFKT